MKKALILQFCLLGTCLNIMAQTIDIDNVRYYFSGANAVVSKYLGGSGVCTIPEKITYNGLNYTVTAIGPTAFYQTQVTEVKLPETILKIGELAFNECKSLVKINLPSSLTQVDERAFCWCTSLTHLIVPESVNFVNNSGAYPNYFFYACNTLRTLIYLGQKPPTNWTATSNTYVPNLKAYSKPSANINNPKIIEMITFDQTEFEYTGQAPTTTWKNNVDGYTASLSLSSLSGEVGNHEEWIPVTFTKDGESFTANVVYRYTVKPAKLTAKVNNVTREYGEENPQFSISYSGFISGESESVLATQPTISTNATKTSNVGEYPITISGGSAANYDISYEFGVLTVTKAPLSAKVNDATKVYGSSNPAFTIDYYGLKNNESAPAWTTRPTFQTDATQSSGVGQYPIKAVNGVPINYDLGEITAGTLNITPAQLTIKANDAVRQYYSDDPNFTYTCSGFVNGDNASVLTATPSLSTSATRTSNVGTYEIKVGDTSSPNYSISFVNGTLTITPRTLIASVGNYERAYNEENPAFEVKYNGFVGNDDEKVLLSKPEAKTSATKTSDVGTYPINVTGGSADNYTFNYSSGILTINKAEQTITWEQDLSDLKVGDQVELKASVTSGLPIKYTMDSNSFAEIYTIGNKSYLDCKANGEFQIVAIQEGSKNYYSSTRIRKTATIGDASAIETIKGSEVQIYRTKSGIRVTDTNVGDVIKIYSVDGLLQKTVKTEDTTTDIPLANNKIYIVKVGEKTVKLSR